MLGERIGEFTGKVVGTRVIAHEGRSPTMEMTEQHTGSLLGVQMTGTATYTAAPEPSGSLLGQGVGFFMTKEGDVLTYKGYGRGRPTGRGGASWRGCFFYESPAQKLARLNSVATVFEIEIDDNGNSRGSIYEWR